MRKMMRVNADLFVKVLGIASIGGGKGFLLLIQPGSALVASCDGTKLGRCHFQTESDEGIDEPVILYPVKSLYKTAETIAKFTDIICVELKESYIELSDDKGGSRVRVALNESDVMFDLTQEESETAVFVTLKTEDFVKLVRSGGAAASKASDAMRGMFFHVNGNKLELTTKSSPMIAYASVEAETVKNANDTWHPANVDFLNAVIGNITGEDGQQYFLCEKWKTVYSGFVLWRQTPWLAGILREYLCETESVEETVIYPAELRWYEECFVTNSLMGIMPVNQLGEWKSVSREVTNRLREKYESM